MKKFFETAIKQWENVKNIEFSGKTNYPKFSGKSLYEEIYSFAVIKVMKDALAEAEKLVRDEVIGVIANKSNDSGFAFGQQIIFPGVLRIPEKEMDFGIVFLSDIHIGSLTFLEDAFSRFIEDT